MSSTCTQRLRAAQEVVLDPTKDVLLLVHGGWHIRAAEALVALHKVCH